LNIDAIPVGENPPEDINVIIEVPIGGEPIKYEMDKKSGALFVDRFLYTPMRYPGNYGFVPHTLSEDGDPIDYSDLPEITLHQVQHFFEHYKDLEEGKWVRIDGWKDASIAQKLIVEAIERHAHP